MTKRKKRDPPIAQLETLPSLSVWFILFSPLFFTLFSFFLDLNNQIHLEKLKFTSQDCSSSSSLSSSTFICSFNDSLLEKNQLRFQLLLDSYILKHIHLYSNIRVITPTTISSSTPPSTSSLLTNNSLSSSSSSSSNNNNNNNNNNLKSLLSEPYEINLKIIGLNKDGNFTQNIYDVSKSKHYYGNHIELGGFTTDSPWFVNPDTYLLGQITINTYSMDISSNIIQNSIFFIEYQRPSFTSLRAFIQVLLTLLSIVVLLFWVSRLFLHHTRLRQSSSLSKVRKCCGFVSAYKCFLSYLLPEQIYTVLLLIFLIMWLDLPGALVTLIVMFVGYTDILTNSLLFKISLIKLYGQQGLFFSLLVLVSSIGCVSEPKRSKGRRQSCETSNISLNGYENDQSGSLQTLSNENTPLISRNFSTLISSLTTTTSKINRVYNDKDKNPRRNSYGTNNNTKSNRNIFLTPEKSPDWFLEENELYDRNSNFEPSPSILNSNRSSNNINTLVNGNSNSNSNSNNETLPFWTKEDSTLTPDYSKVNYDEIGYCLSRSYAELPNEPCPPLVKSHPCSNDFIEFIGHKLLILFISLFTITIQNFLTYPIMLNSLRVNNLDQDVELFLYCLVSIIVVPIRLAWIIYIFDAVIKSSSNLGKVHYMESRYQQIAFRLLVNLIVIGMILLGGTYLFSIYHFFKVMSNSMISEYSLGDLWIKTTTTADSGYGSWGGRYSELGELIYVTGIVYIISFIFAAPLPSSYDNIYSHSDQGLAGTIHEYQVMEISSLNSSPLERNIQVRNRSNSISNILIPLFGISEFPNLKKKYFCLETACILMECTWQTYFEPLDEPRNEIEEKSRKACHDIFASMLGTCVDCPMNVSQYGLQFDRSFLSLKGDISGYICHSHIDHRMIIAFRGTVGGSNMVTDMNMIQTRLPNMKKSNQEIEDIFQSVIQEFTLNLRDVLSPVSSSSINSTPLSKNKENEENKELNENSNNSGNNNNNSNNSHIFNEINLSYDSHDFIQNNQFNDEEKQLLSLNNNDDNGENNNNNRWCSWCNYCSNCLSMNVPLVHLGFWQAYCSVRKEFWKCLLITILTNITTIKSCEIFLCGHSLGGSLAILAGIDIQLNLSSFLLKISNYYKQNFNNYQKNLIIYTFGSPKIGNISFCKFVESMISNIFRIEVDGDIICRLPNIFGLYRHCGVHIVIDSDNQGNLIVNPTIVERILLSRSNGTTANHTLSKYRECLEACFLPNELDDFLLKYYQLSLQYNNQKSNNDNNDSNNNGHQNNSNNNNNSKYQNSTSKLPIWL